MSDEAPEAKAETPAFDPTSILGKLKDLVATKTTASGGGGSSWAGTLILIAITLVGAAVWAWVSWRRNQELAKLRHEKFVTQVHADQDIIDSKLRLDAGKIEQSKAIVTAAVEKVRLLDADIKAEEARYAADLRAIDSIRSWADVDRSVR